MRHDAAARRAAAGSAGRPARRALRRGRRASAARAPERALRADRTAPSAGQHPARVAVVRERVQLAARRRARASRRAPRSSSRATSPTVMIPRARSFSAVTGPTPHSRSTGSGCRKPSSASGRHDQQAVGLRDAARDLREELRPRDADRDRQPDLLEHAAPQPRGDLRGRARDPLHPAHVEERLVDREPLDQRRRVARRPRRPPCSPRSRPTCAAATTTASGHSRRACRAAHRGRARRAPWPRSSPRARRRRRRSPAGRAAAARPAARPTRRTHRGRHAGWWPLITRTHVRIPGTTGSDSTPPISLGWSVRRAFGPGRCARVPQSLPH